LLYFLSAIISAIIGSLAGIGGGIILRPALSLLGVGSVLVSFTTASFVLAMAVINITTRRIWTMDIKYKRLVYLAAGSTIGAFFGAFTLRFINSFFIDIAFIVVMLILIFLLIVKKHIRSLSTDNPVLSILIGFGTGFLSGLFGIGGGPFQMIALLFLFDSKPKEAVIQSIFITMLTSAVSLLSYTLNGFADLSVSIYVVPGGIAGALIGSILIKKLEEKHITMMLVIIFTAVILSQVYVIFTSL